MFEEKVRKLIDSYNGHYELISYHTRDYLSNGFGIVVKAKFPQRLTQDSINYGNAKAIIKGQEISLNGFLGDIKNILDMIVGY